MPGAGRIYSRKTSNFITAATTCSQRNENWMNMQKIYSAFYTSPIGPLRVSSNDSCITEVHFLNKDEPFAEGTLPTGAPSVLAQCLKELTAYFNGQRKNFEVPVCQEGTAFQQRVWNE